MNSSMKAAKEQADRLTARLKTLGVDLKNTQALEAIAAVHNFTDWNRYSAYLNRVQPTPASLEAQRTRNVDQIRHAILMMRPGTGKSSVLAFMFANTLRNGEGIPLWIDCVEPGNDYRLPESVLADVITLKATISADGAVQIDRPPVDAKAIRLVADMSRFIRQPSIASEAFCQLADAVNRDWPVEIKNRIELTCVDELSRLGEEFEAAFQTALPKLAFNRARVLLAAQHMNHHYTSPLQYWIVTEGKKDVDPGVVCARTLKPDPRITYVGPLPSSCKQYRLSEENPLLDVVRIIQAALKGELLALDTTTPQGELLSDLLSHWQMLANQRARACS